MRLRSAATTLLVAAVATAIGPQEARGVLYERLSTAQGVPFAVVRPEISAIDNFAEVEPGLARGARLSQEGVDYLRAQGYRTVVAFSSDSKERERLARAGIDLVAIPMNAGLLGAAVPNDEQIRAFLSVATDPARRPLYFHCKRGRDRTGAMAAIYRMERQGWSAADAVDEMKALGFHTYYKKLYRFVRGYSRGAGVASTPSSHAAP